MSSEESESEIEVVQEQQNTEESASVEQEQTQSEESSEESSEQTVQKEENNPPPPPPPTSGDLINLVVTPAFPKDLVGTRSEGQVRLIAEVSRQGTVNNITIQESSGFESMDRVALMTVERGWTFKEYQQPYRIPVLVNYYFDESDNTQVEVELGEVQFISGGE
jgi:protein TonB